MGLFSKIFLKLKGASKSCFFCHRKTSGMRYYRNDKNKKIAVCPMCVEYAERRAYRKI